MRSCRNVPAGSAPPRHSRTRDPAAAAQRLAQPAAGAIAGRARTSAGTGAVARAPRRAATGSRTARSVAGGLPSSVCRSRQPRDERGMVLEARAVDDAARRAPPPRRRRARSGSPARHDAAARRAGRGRRTGRTRPPLTVAPRQVGEHARAQGDQEEWLTRCDGAEHTLDQRDEERRRHEVGGRPGVQRVARRRAATRRSSAAPGAPRRCARRRRRAPSRARADTARRRVGAALACDQRVGRTPPAAAGAARRSRHAPPSRHPAPPRARGRRPRTVSAKSVTYSDAIESRAAAVAIASRRPMSGSERTSCSTGSSQPARAGEPDRRVRGTRVGGVERAQRRREFLPQPRRRQARLWPAAPAAARSPGSCSPVPRGALALHGCPNGLAMRARPRAPAPGRPRSRCAACPRRTCRGSRGSA